MKRIVFWLTVAALAGCAGFQSPTAPRYRTDHLYEGPASDEGQRCVRRCEKNKEYCRQVAERGTQDEYLKCDEEAQDEYENCTMRTTSFSEKRQCYRKSCPVGADYVNCESGYRNCFEGCGGQVWSRQVCEENC